MRRLFAVVLAVGSVSSLGAQSDTTKQTRHPTTLPPIVVTGSIVPRIGPIVGASHASSRVIALDSVQLTRWRHRLLPDALGGLPGVSVYDDDGSPSKLELTLRGFSVGPTVGLPAGVTVFVDGIRQNEPDGHQVDFDLLPLDHVTRIEVLEGTAALLGPNSLGGAVNLVTDRGGRAPEGTLEVGGGSFGGFQTRATLATRTRGGTDFYAGLDVDRADGWREATAWRRLHGLINLGHLGPQSGIALQVFGGSARAQTAGSMPESVFLRNPRVNFTPGDEDNIQGARAALLGYVPALTGRLSMSASWRRTAADRFNVNQAPDPDVKGGTTGSTVGLNADWQLARSLGPGVLGVRLGVDGSRSEARVRIFNRPPGIGPDGSSGQDLLTTDVESPSTSVAGIVGFDYQVARWQLAIGARYDVTRVPFHDRLDPTDQTTSTFHRVSPRVELSYGAQAPVTVFGSIAGSFRPPAILELGCADPEATCPLPFALSDDPPLRPVRATTYEAGLRWRRGGLLGTVTGYRTEVRDEILFVASPGALLSGYFTNLDRTRREGLTASIASDGSHRLDWYLNGSLDRATFRSAIQLFSVRSDEDFTASPYAGANRVESGARIPLVPNGTLKAGATIALNRTVAMGVSGRWIGQQWLRGDEANETRPLESYAIADASIRLTPGPWAFTVLLDNLFDTVRPVFGTFNENRETGELERFLTPASTRMIRVIASRAFRFGRSQ